MSQKTIQLSFFVILTLGLFTVSFFMFQPYLGVIFLSFVLAVTFYPLYLRLIIKFGGHRQLASFSTVLFVIICVVIPLAFVFSILLKEAIGLYNSLAFGGQNSGLVYESNLFFNRLKSVLPGGFFYQNLNIESYARDFLGWIISHFDSIFAAIFDGIFKFILMLLSLYYFLIYGDSLKKNIVLWSPLPDIYDEEVIKALHSSVDAVLRGRILISLAQGVFIGLGFAIFGVGSPVLWGFVGGIASLVPIFGTAIIIIPAVLYLIISGSIFAGIGLLIWGVLAVGLVDNVLSFFFFKGKIKVHPLIVFFSILGGLELFGAIGFLVGPVIVSTFLSFMKIYPFIMSYRNELLVKKSDGQ